MLMKRVNAIVKRNIGVNRILFPGPLSLRNFAPALLTLCACELLASLFGFGLSYGHSKISSEKLCDPEV